MRGNKGLLLLIAVFTGIIALVSGMRHVSFTMSGQKGNTLVVIIGYVPGCIQVSPRIDGNESPQDGSSSEQ